MPKRIILPMLLVALTGCASPQTEAPPTTPGGPLLVGFEEGLVGWEKRAHVPEDPNQGAGATVNWSIEATTERVHAGSKALEFYLDGRQDDGTIWVQRALALAGGHAYHFNASVFAWSGGESFNTIANLVFYLGTSAPTEEASFKDFNNEAGAPGSGGLRQPLNRVEGWDAYGFEWTSPVLANGTIVVAVGITAVWETEMTYFVDDLRVAWTQV